MTVNQAYSVLGLHPGASRIDIEQAYTASLRILRLQMVPGMPLATRRDAQDQILELNAAFELVKNAARPAAPPKGSRKCPPPRVQPAGRYAGQPGASSQTAGKPVSTVSILMVAASVVLVGIVVLLVVLFSMRSRAPETASRTAVRSTAPSRTARLRVLSVPWSYVEVNGTPLGPSGQADAFTVQPGECQLVLRWSSTAWATTISVRENCETIVQAQLEKGQIHVSHKKIPLAPD